jgi:RHS repeat-associated protein
MKIKDARPERRRSAIVVCVSLVILTCLGACLLVWNVRAAKHSVGTLPLIRTRSNLNKPDLFAFSRPANNFVTVSGAPASIRFVAPGKGSDILPAGFAAANHLTIANKIVLNTSTTAKFNCGYIFAGFSNGRILRVDASTQLAALISLPNEPDAIDGGLSVDDSGLFGHDLVAASGRGRIWQIGSFGEASMITDLATRVSGLVILPDDRERFGPLAGTLLVGAPEKFGIFSVAPNGTSTFFSLDAAVRDVVLAASGHNVFGLSRDESAIYGLGLAGRSDEPGNIERDRIILTTSDRNELIFLQPLPGMLVAKHVELAVTIDQLVAAPLPIIPESLACVTSISPSHASFQWPGGTAALNVSAPDGCLWTAASDALWTEIISGQSGTGNGTVTYSVGKNGTFSLRGSHVTVDTHSHNIDQSRKAQLHCNVGLSPANVSIDAIGGNGTVNVSQSSDCAWTAVSDSSWLVLSGNSGSGNGSFSYTTSTNFTAQARSAFVSFPGISGGVGSFTQSPNLAPAVNSGQDQVIALPDSAALTATVTDDGVGSGITTLWTKVSGPESVLFSNAASLNSNAIFSKEGIYILRLTASDGYLTAFDDIQITVNPDPVPPPPDPATIAPPIDPNVATNPFDATKFLYTGPNAIQTGVAAGTIKATSIAIFRGRTITKSGQPIPKVKISVLGRPELGQTLTRADGMFDLVVNGGGELILKYEKPAFVTVQRLEKPDWQEYAVADDVVMIPYDGNSSFIDLTANSPIQMAQGGVISDTSGTRRSRLFFKQGTTATMRLPNGTTQPLTSMNVRSSEFTVGANGPETMPGDLPPLSAYTYASEYSVDEAVAASATEVTFSQPVAQYNENFLNFPVGTIIPSGSYDKATGIWMPSASGRVVKILSISNGLADLDITGSGTAASNAELTALGVNSAERQQLTAIYSVNQSLWRVPVLHFSAWDSNWGFGPPPGGGPPSGGSSSGGGGGPPCNCPPNGSSQGPGSIIGMEDQRLSEEVSVVGTPFHLRYDSTRPHGNISNNTLNIPLNASLPGAVKRVEMSVSIGGQMHEFSFPPLANQSTAFTWDGNDAYGRALQGQQEATIDISNVYDGVYQNTGNFGYNGNGVPITGSTTRQEVSLHKIQRVILGTNSAPPEDLGGWSLNTHHAYDPIGHTLYQGDGIVRNVDTVSNGIDGFAGGLTGYLDGPIAEARFSRPFGIAVAADNAIFVADTSNQRLRRIDTNGNVTTFAGNGNGCNPFNYPCGDGGPALNASPGGISRVAIGPDGTIFIGGGRNVWSITADGIFHRVSGTNTAGFSGDGGPARDAQTSDLTRPFPAADGSIYLTDMNNYRIRRIDPNGIISTIAGTGVQGFSGDGGPATQAQISQVGDLVPAPDGNVYFMDMFPNNRIRRIGTDGIITTIAGTGVYGDNGDGGPALSASFAFDPVNGPVIGSMHIDSEGSLYVASYRFAGGRIRKISRDGIVTAVVGNGLLGGQGDGGPALQAPTNLMGFNIGPDNSIYMVGGGIGTDFDESKIRRVSAPLPGFNGSAIAIPSADGSQLFRFDAAGRHLNTVNTRTNAIVFTFNYDAAGRLASIVDGNNNITTVERNGSGAPTGILSPYNQRTTLSRDANGYLASITNPANEQHQFTYNAGGQMLTFRDPRGNLTQFTYDAMGRLIRDSDAGTGSQTLARTDTGVNFAVTHTTALNRQTVYQVNSLSNGDRQRTTVLPDGAQARFLEQANGTDTLTDPNGMVSSKTRSGDPRWKLQAPITANTNFTTPGNLTYNATFARTATLANPADVLSLTSQTDTYSINNRTATSVFTAATRTFGYTSPENRQLSAVIDGQNRPLSFKIGQLTSLDFAYDTRGRLNSLGVSAGTEFIGSTVNYDPAGFLSAVTDPLGRTTGFSHDLAGRVVQLTLADSRMIGFGYDAAGNLTSVTPSGRPAHTFTYDPRNLLSSYTAPGVGGGSSTTSYDYNSDRQLIRTTRPDALQLNYAYDPAGRLQNIAIPTGGYAITYNATSGTVSSITSPGGSNLSYLYDGFLVTRQTWTGAVAGNVSQTFDNNFRVTSQSVNGANTVNYSYNTDNLLTAAGSETFTRSADTGLLTSSTLLNTSETYSNDNFLQQSGYNVKFNSATVFNSTFSRDGFGRIVQKVETIGGSTDTYAFAYDSTGRLTTVSLNGSTQPLVTYGYDSNNNRTTRNIGGSITNAAFDSQDRLTSFGTTTYSYTANGELQTKVSPGAATTYNYDVLGNLRGVSLPGGTQIEYLIDGQNRRIGKRINGTLTQGFLYQNQLKPAAELDGGNNIVSRFVYASHPNTPDYMIKNGNTYRIISDQVGSVRLVVDAATGSIAQRIDYDEFGVVLQDSNPGFQPFGFAGGIYDPQTKLVRFGNRDYDAETGRWTAKDPLLFNGGVTNLYSYALNDPVNHTDPNGLFGAQDALVYLGIPAPIATFVYGLTVLSLKANGAPYADWFSGSLPPVFERFILSQIVPDICGNTFELNKTVSVYVQRKGYNPPFVGPYSPDYYPYSYPTDNANKDGNPASSEPYTPQRDPNHEAGGVYAVNGGQ